MAVQYSCSALPLGNCTIICKTECVESENDYAWTRWFLSLLDLRKFRRWISPSSRPQLTYQNRSCPNVHDVVSAIVLLHAM